MFGEINQRGIIWFFRLLTMVNLWFFRYVRYSRKVKKSKTCPHWLLMELMRRNATSNSGRWFVHHEHFLWMNEEKKINVSYSMIYHQFLRGRERPRERKKKNARSGLVYFDGSLVCNSSSKWAVFVINI